MAPSYSLIFARCFNEAAASNAAEMHVLANERLGRLEASMRPRQVMPRRWTWLPRLPCATCGLQ